MPGATHRRTARPGCGNSVRRTGAVATAPEDRRAAGVPRVQSRARPAAEATASPGPAAAGAADHHQLLCPDAASPPGHAVDPLSVPVTQSTGTPEASTPVGRRRQTPPPVPPPRPPEYPARAAGCGRICRAQRNSSRTGRCAGQQSVAHQHGLAQQSRRRGGELPALHRLPVPCRLRLPDGTASGGSRTSLRSWGVRRCPAGSS